MKTGKKFLSLGAAFCIATSVLFTSAVPVFASTNNSTLSGKIDVEGVIIPKNPTFSMQDALWIKLIINKRKTPTGEDIQKYDIDKDGKITTVDYLLIKHFLQLQF